MKGVCASVQRYAFGGGPQRIGVFVAVILAALVGLLGCSAPANRSKPARVASLTDQQQLRRDFMWSLTSEQVRAANLHYDRHPEHIGTGTRDGEGLPWTRLTASQQTTLEALCAAHDAMAESVSPERQLKPGPIEQAEVFAVGYAFMDNIPGREHMELEFQVCRGDYTVAFSFDLDGSAPLPPAVKEAGIDLRAAGVIQPLTKEQMDAYAAKVIRERDARRAAASPPAPSNSP